MDELSPRSRALLAEAQDGHEPPAGASARVWQGVSSDIANGVTFEGTRALARPSTWGGGGSGLIGKMMWIVAAIGGVGIAAFMLLARQAPPVASAPVAIPSLAAPAAVEPASGNAPPAAASPMAETDEAASMAEPSPRPARGGSGERDTLLAEVVALRRASDALAADQPEQALALLRAHAKQFSRGALREERAALVLLARCALDASAVAASARAFVARTPNAILRGRVERACKLTGEDS